MGDASPAWLAALGARFGRYPVESSGADRAWESQPLPENARGGFVH